MLQKKVEYSGVMDDECIPLCDAINSIPGLRTVESCCGHGERQFSIWFDVEFPSHLPILLYYCDPCHVGFRWNCVVTTDCGMSPVTFRIQSESQGEQSYAEANTIAESIVEYLKQEKIHAQD